MSSGLCFGKGRESFDLEEIEFILRTSFEKRGKEKVKKRREMREGVSSGRQERHKKKKIYI